MKLTEEMRSLLEQIASLEDQFRVLEQEVITGPDGEYISSPVDLSAYLVYLELEAAE